MSMNKVIHCAVRRDLDRLQDALGSFSDGDKARASGLGRAWTYLDSELTHHHEGEHRIAWPALTAIGVERSTLDQFEEEHEALATALTAGREAMVKLAGSGARADADAAAAAMAALNQVATTHLDNEEAVTEPLFAENAGSPVLKEMGKKFARDRSLKVSAEFFAWVQYGANAEEMTALKQNVPGPVLAILPKLFGRRYHKEIAPIWR